MKIMDGAPRPAGRAGGGGGGAREKKSSSSSRSRAIILYFPLQDACFGFCAHTSSALSPITFLIFDLLHVAGCVVDPPRTILVVALHDHDQLATRRNNVDEEQADENI